MLRNGLYPLSTCVACAVEWPRSRWYRIRARGQSSPAPTSRRSKPRSTNPSSPRRNPRSSWAAGSQRPGRPGTHAPPRDGRQPYISPRSSTIVIPSGRFATIAMIRCCNVPRPRPTRPGSRGRSRCTNLHEPVVGTVDMVILAGGTRGRGLEAIGQPRFGGLA